MAVSIESNGRVSQRFNSHALFSLSLGTVPSSTDDHLVAGCTLEGDVPGVSGNGTLATVVFYAKDVGECSLHLYGVTLLNSAELQIDCSTQDAYGTFTPPMGGGGGGRVPYLT